MMIWLTSNGWQIEDYDNSNNQSAINLAISHAASHNAPYFSTAATGSFTESTVHRMNIANILPRVEQSLE